MKGSRWQRDFISEPKVSLAATEKELGSGKVEFQARFVCLFVGRSPRRVPNLGFPFPQMLVLHVQYTVGYVEGRSRSFHVTHDTLRHLVISWHRVSSHRLIPSPVLLFEQQKISFGI